MKGGLKRARQEAGHRDGWSMRRVDKRWQARCGQIAQWCKKSGKRVRKSRKAVGRVPQFLQAKRFWMVFGPYIAYSVTFLKPGNFRYPACPGSTCNREGGYCKEITNQPLHADSILEVYHLAIKRG